MLGRPDEALGGGNQGPSAPGWARHPSAQKSAFLCHPGLRQAPSLTPYILTPKPQGKPEALQGQQDLTLLMPQGTLIGLLCKLLKPTNGKVSLLFFETLHSDEYSFPFLL